MVSVEERRRLRRCGLVGGGDAERSEAASRRDMAGIQAVAGRVRRDAGRVTII
jgi:hypothetical protein